MIRMQPITEGEWVRIARKHYRHESGVEIRYDWNRCLWQIIGGRYDSLYYERLWAAQHAAV